MATDINHSGSLRYRSLYLYALTETSAGKAEDWRASLESMAKIYHDLRLRHPAEVAPMDETWSTFRDSLSRSGHLSWNLAERMRAEADVLTNTLNYEAVRRSTLSDQLFWCGITTLALALPWSLYLTRRLQESQSEILRQAQLFAQLSARFQNLFDYTPTACFVYDNKGRVTEWNRASELLFEKSAEQVIGKFLWDVIARPTRRDSTREAVQRLLSGVSHIDLDWTYATPGGVEKTVVSSVIPLYVDGVVTSGISVSTDVTVARAAVESERALAGELAASEARLRNVTSRSSCLLWEANIVVADTYPGFAGLFWNEEKRTFLAWDLRLLHEEEAYHWLPVERAVGQPFGLAWQDSIPDSNRAAGNARSYEALRQGEDHYTQEFPCRLADGSVRWLLENVEVKCVEGDPMRWHLVGVCTDISALKHSEEKLKSLTKELQRSNESLQEFAYIASHDLKEPLRKIQTFGGMLKRRVENALPPDCLDYLMRMIAASERMQALVEGLLDYSRVSNKARVLTPVDLNETVRGVLSDLEQQIGAEVGKVVVGSLPVIRTDALQMRQLFQNLISNALKFHKPGETPIVHVCWEDEPSDESGAMPDTVRIAVSDNGIGFEEKQARHIFEMFEQLEAGSHKVAGTGVGLAICRKIVERQGGAITAKSAPGQGAKFTIQLPRG